MEIKKTGVVKGKGDDVTGNLVRVKVAKNKLAPPFRTADFELTYGAGVSRSGEVVDLGVAAGVLSRSGAWYTFATPAAAAAVNAALASAAQRVAAGGGAERAAGAARVWDLYAKGVLKVTIGQTYALEDAAQAHADIEGRRTTGSTVLRP